MPASVATLVYALGILGIFLLDRERESPSSPALWIPVAWLSIGASRSVGQWLGLAPITMTSAEQYLDGSPLDRVIFTGLLAAGLFVLLARSHRVGPVLRANGPLLVFFVYCAVSVLWSDYPFVAFKRWTKAVGNLVMVLIVLTDPDPRAALRRVLARSGFLLIPLSVLFIKYYPELGRGFDFWTGRAYNMGVAIDKNGLGILCMVFGLGSLWRFLVAFQSGERPRPAGPLIAHGAIVAMTLWLLSMANSATSLGSFVAGAALLVLTNWRSFALIPGAVHVTSAAMVAVCVFGLFVDSGVGLVQAIGRDPTLTTRTQLWEELLRIPVDPLLGAGFESFWLGERAQTLWRTHWWHPNQAHNGYLEVYLNSGWLGVGLLGLVVAWGYRNVVAALRQDPPLGRLKLALFIAAVLYNLTEAAFKVMHPVWIAFLLAVTLAPSFVPVRAASPSRLPRAGWLPAGVPAVPERTLPRGR